MIGVIVPFAIGPDRALLARLAPGIVWIAAFLSMLLGPRPAVPRRRRGRLAAAVPPRGPAARGHRCRKSDRPLAADGAAADRRHAGARAAAGRWTCSSWWRTVLSLLLGTPALVAFGALGAAVTVGLRRGGLIAPVLILPLCIPVLIFGVGAIGGPLAARGATCCSSPPSAWWSPPLRHLPQRLPCAWPGTRATRMSVEAAAKKPNWFSRLAHPGQFLAWSRPHRAAAGDRHRGRCSPSACGSPSSTRPRTTRWATWCG